MRYDYDKMTNQQLAALMRQYRKSRLELECEFGHENCGCSNVSTMNGLAACSLRVEVQIAMRRGD